MMRCFAVLLLVIGSCLSTCSADTPNVILVMCDDMGWGDPQCFDASSPVKTPHIDALAASGLKFNRFYSAAPVCSPTRGSCLTGRHPYRYGVYSANTGHMRDGEITLPELLKEHGYATGHFGKWHLGTLTTEIKDSNRGGPNNREHFSPPTRHGYDICFVTEAKVPTYDPMLKPRGGGNNGWDFITDKSTALPYGTHYWNEAGEIVTDNLEGDDSRVIMDRATGFIESSVREKRPFFAAVWFHAPHLPVVAGPDHVAAYAEYDVRTRNYYGCIAGIDEQVGRLQTLLRDLEIAENTMLWFCSDNGPEGQAGRAPGSAGPFRGRKRSLYEGGVRVPGVLVWPSRVAAGRETDFPAVTSDYLPTILDVLEIEYPDHRPVDGISLLPVIDGDVTERDAPIGFQSARQRSWVEQRHKLYSADAGKTWELYDLVSDPSEARDLAADMPERVEALRSAFDVWAESCRGSDEGGDYR